MLVGTKLGAYEVIAKLGEGGMGEVYRARDTRLGRDVAIKILPSGASIDADRLARFEQEARAAAALNHPNITALFDIGSYSPADAATVVPYMVTELLEGATLRERLADGALPIRTALGYAREIASGLAAAHEKGIVHRDLKPENVFVTTDQRVKILDFGLAKLTESPAAASTATALPTTPRVTMPGMVLGTAGYMAPEQVRGLAADHRADIFAFGAVLYEMMSGQRAFTGETPMDVMMAVARADPPPLGVARPDAPPALTRLVERCLEKSPAARFQSTRDLAFALETPLSTSSGTAAASVPREVGPSRGASRRGALAWMAAGLVLGAVAAFLVASRREPDGEAPPAIALTLPSDFPYFRLPGVYPAVSGRWNPSPDNRWMLGITLLQDGRSAFVLHQLATGTTRQLATTAGNVFVTNSAWSPDSKDVAYWDGTDGMLKRITIESGAIARLGQFRDVRAIAWGPQGIVFTNLPGGEGFGTFVIPADGGEPRSIAESMGLAALLPNGWILAGSFGDRNDLVLLDETGQPRTLMAGVEALGYAAGHVLYNLQDTLVAHRLDEGRRALVGEPIPLGESSFDRVFANDVLLTWSAAVPGVAGSLAWVDRHGRRNVVPGGPKTLALGATLAMHDDLLLATSMSPAGRLRNQSDVYIVRLDTGTLTRVFEGPTTWDTHPRWSRDGARLLFRSSNALIRAEVGRGGTPVTVVPSIEGLERLEDWSADEAHALVGVATAERRYDVLDVDLKTGTLTPVAATSATESLARFSPDSTLVAYVSDETGPPEVYVKTFPVTGPSTRVSLSGGTLPKWSRDGSRIYFFSPDGWIMEAAVTRERREMRVGQPIRVVPGSGADFLPSSDGQRFLVLEPWPTRPIALLNWRSRLAAR
jgi:Tol biopolymer transport system component